uniref:Uncharacterized protein n=1 Tax=Romanomermis culicivorax TaxID=13658 RepID=A0A915K941_ROMCU
MTCPKVDLLITPESTADGCNEGALVTLGGMLNSSLASILYKLFFVEAGRFFGHAETFSSGINDQAWKKQFSFLLHTVRVQNFFQIAIALFSIYKGDVGKFGRRKKNDGAVKVQKR